MEIGAAEYRAAAEEHLKAAAACILDDDHLTCHYLSGLAVECILRAYRWRIDGSWDGRHVLPRLYKAARFDQIVPEALVAEIAQQFGTVTVRWSNDHRFTSPVKLIKHLNALGPTINVKGDKLKRNSQEMYSAAERIVGLGIQKWKN